MKFRDHAFATDHGQGNQHADGLGQGGAKRRACGTKLQHADEQIIQGNIKSTGNRNEKHRTLRVAHAAENGADDVVGCDKRDTEKTDGQVADPRPPYMRYEEYERLATELKEMQKTYLAACVGSLTTFQKKYGL